MQVSAHVVSVRGGQEYSTDYLVYLPRDYDRAGGVWPLLLFLHGSEQRGERLDQVKEAGIPMRIEAGSHYPFIVVSPQCANEESWEPERLLALLDHIAEEFAVDRDRVSVTGFELGGFGTWNLAAADPNRFAAIAPICGFPANEHRQKDVEWLRTLPIWAFHGTLDQTTWFPLVEQLFARLYAIGAPARLTVVPETRNGQSWVKLYDSPELTDWLASKAHWRAAESAWGNGDPSPGEQIAGVFRIKNQGENQTADSALPYSVYLPEAYNASEYSWPLLLFLSGGTQQQLGSTGPPLLMKDGHELPFVVVSLDCTTLGPSRSESLFRLLDHLQCSFRIDPTRVHVGGVAAGGDAAWETAIADPSRFASMLPIGSIPKDEARYLSHYLKSLAIWAIHWDEKEAARLSYVRDMIERLNQRGSVRVTLVPKPDAWADLFQDPQMAEWITTHAQDTNHPDIAEWVGHVRGVFPAPRAVIDSFESIEYRFTGGRYKSHPFRYRLFVPKPMEPGKQYPLILWLHGHGWEELELDAGHLKYMELILKDPSHREQYPFFVLALQCPADRSWFDGHKGPDTASLQRRSDEPGEVLMRIVEDLLSEFPIAPDRVAAFGISSGANACWELAMRYPDRFSAIAPCGGTDVPDMRGIKRVRGVQVWPFHSVFDNVAPIVGVRKTVAAARTAGVTTELTEVPNGTHLCWYDAFEDYNLLNRLILAKRTTYIDTFSYYAAIVVGVSIALYLSNRALKLYKIRTLRRARS